MVLEGQGESESLEIIDMDAGKDRDTMRAPNSRLEKRDGRSF